MSQRRVNGSPFESSRVPTGMPTKAPAAMMKTSRRSAMRKAGGIMPSVRTPSTTSSTAEATRGPTMALASGMKISAAPKPEKPRARPARNAAPANIASSVGLWAVMRDEKKSRWDMGDGTVVRISFFYLACTHRSRKFPFMAA
ncbi:hypothetical protein D3C78_1113370 [compost metagenome]